MMSRKCMIKGGITLLQVSASHAGSCRWTESGIRRAILRYVVDYTCFIYILRMVLDVLAASVLAARRVRAAPEGLFDRERLRGETPVSIFFYNNLWCA